jgi:hypothetical protein
LSCSQYVKMRGGQLAGNALWRSAGVPPALGSNSRAGRPMLHSFSEYGPNRHQRDDRESRQGACATLCQIFSSAAFLAASPDVRIRRRLEACATFPQKLCSIGRPARILRASCVPIYLPAGLYSFGKSGRDARAPLQRVANHWTASCARGSVAGAFARLRQTLMCPIPKGQKSPRLTILPWGELLPWSWDTWPRCSRYRF